MTTLQQIELQCPICETRFRSQAVVSTNSFGGKRTDFHERAAGTQPLPYLIHTCNRCGYSGADSDFTEEADVSPVLKERARWVAPVLDAPKPPPRRLTVTLPVLNAGQQVVFMVAGRDKAPALREVLEGTAPPEQYPAKCIQPGPERLLWLVDEAAGAELR